jgi:hypothetical protein
MAVQVHRRARGTIHVDFGASGSIEARIYRPARERREGSIYLTIVTGDTEEGRWDERAEVLIPVDEWDEFTRLLGETEPGSSSVRSWQSAEAMKVSAQIEQESTISASFGINGTMGSIDATLQADGKGLRLEATSGMRDWGDMRPSDEAMIVIGREEWLAVAAMIEEQLAAS